MDNNFNTPNVGDEKQQTNNQNYNSSSYAQQQSNNPNANSYYNYGYGQQQSYDPNANGYYNYGYGQQQSYDPNANSYYNYGYGQQQSYDSNASGYYNYGYGQQQQSYDPNTNSYYNYGYNQQGNYNNQATGQMNSDPNNPMRLTVSPSNPSTSSNNITLNLDSLYEKLNNELNKPKEEVEYNKELKEFFNVFIQNGVYINIYSYLGENESPIGSGTVGSINNNTIAVNNKVISIKYISYVMFTSEKIDDNIINTYFYNRAMFKHTQNQSNNNKDINNIKNDFFTFLYSRKSFNQYLSLTIESSFLTELTKLLVVDLNEDIVVLKSDEIYYAVPIEKIVAIE